MNPFLGPEQKALEINLDAKIYGSFAEIGAGQEVARYFFTAGAAAGTIAKTISAYDKVVSDHVYGLEASGRYVCESRLYKMLDHEFDLMIDRLSDERPNCCFFSFADTVETLNYHKTNRGSGWLGLRFQLKPQGEANDLVIHVEMLDNNTALQQQAIGILGVNMIYACYRAYEQPKQMLQLLMEQIRDRVRIDMIRLSGPQFSQVDNRLLTLELVRQKMTEVAMFDKRGKPIHPSEFLYKKNVLIVRGSYRPATLVNLDMLQTASQQFKAEPEVQSNRTQVLAEITLSSLCSENGEIEDRDFLDRADLLGHLGQYVVISNSDQYGSLINYLYQYRIARLGLVIGARPLLNLLNSKYYKDKERSLLSSFGELFTHSVRMYVYPAQKEGTGELMRADNLPIPQGLEQLYAHLLNNKQIVDITGFNASILHIYSFEVLRMIRNDETGWEQFLPAKVAQFIREKQLFDLPSQKIEFDY